MPLREYTDEGPGVGKPGREFWGSASQAPGFTLDRTDKTKVLKQKTFASESHILESDSIGRTIT